jgi:hypothetical protein
MQAMPTFTDTRWTPTSDAARLGMRFYQWMMEVDRKARLLNQDRLRALSLDRT